MSAYPLMLEGSTIRALVVGGGAVAVRKVRALVAAGATVRVVALHAANELHALASPALRIDERAYAVDDIGDASLVIAATGSRDVNAQVAADAVRLGRLVNVADAPGEGNCVTPAVHRSGDLVVAVTAGGVPAAASRIRDSIAARYSTRYADAIAELASLRAGLVHAGQRDRWAAAATELVGDDFCELVELGELPARVAAWR